MNHPTDQMDRAIDQVANRMVSVPDNHQLFDAIVTSLPERTSNRWNIVWAPLAVGMAVLLIAVAVRRNNDVGPTRTVASSNHVALAELVKPVVPNEPVEPVERVERVEPAASNDFDRQYGLAPVAAPAAIALKSIAVDDALSVSASQLAPIVITDLLSSDDSSSRD